MLEAKIAGIQGRIAATVLYGMVCALEIRGLMAVLAGKSILDLPLYWEIAFAAFCLWFCWEIFRKEYKKSGPVLALLAVLISSFSHLAPIGRLLRDNFVKHKVLDPPSDAMMLVYAGLVCLSVWMFFRRNPANGIHLTTNDRYAILLLAVLVATKMGMRFASGHNAILLKEAGCAAVLIGAIVMILSVLNALSPEQSEFPAIPDSLS